MVYSVANDLEVDSRWPQ